MNIFKEIFNKMLGINDQTDLEDDDSIIIENMGDVDIEQYDSYYTISNIPDGPMYDDAFEAETLEDQIPEAIEEHTIVYEPVNETIVETQIEDEPIRIDPPSPPGGRANMGKRRIKK